MATISEALAVAIGHHEAGRLQEAERICRSIVDAEPQYARAWHLLGRLCHRRGNCEGAIRYLGRAVALGPSDALAHNDLGHAYQDLCQEAEAANCYRRALELRPDFAEAHCNLGLSLLRVKELAGAGYHYQRAIELKRDLAEAHANLAALMLLQGDLESGWQEYEWRWKTAALQSRFFRRPRWSGEALNGQRILVHAEQGLGDTLQFVRYATLVKARGGRVILACQSALLPLLGSGPGIDERMGEQIGQACFDVHAPLLTLPGIFRTTLETIPTLVPYLFADPALVESWGAKLAGIAGFRIGVSWRGGKQDNVFKHRDIPLDCFASVANVPGVRLISLQKGKGREELAWAGFPVIDLGDGVDTSHGAFMDTAAIMMNVDLVITSDTSIAHLAGALGVPVWVGLPFVPDWRWLLDRSDSPWYPTMRLFRQRQAGDWAGVFVEMQAALRAQLEPRNNSPNSGA